MLLEHKTTNEMLLNTYADVAFKNHQCTLTCLQCDVPPLLSYPEILTKLDFVSTVSVLDRLSSNVVSIVYSGTQRPK